MKNERLGFATRMGAIAATVGSAVGLGNIWRFPYEAGQNGGGAFIIVYIICVVLLGIPVMLSEFIIGRSTHKNMKGAIKQLSPKSHFHLFTYVCILGSLIILSFYSVVCGWVMDYLYQAITGGLEKAASSGGYTAMFENFTATPWRCVMWTLIFLAINALVMLRGVRKGIEKVANIMMPVLFILLIVFCINSVLLPNAGKGLSFVFAPDFSKLTVPGVIDAFGQAFMSLSLGISALVTYSSYFSDKTPLARDATIIAVLDTLVALLAGIMIFPAVFSYGMTPEAGPKLVFEVLPAIFSQMPGGYIWAILFFLLLFFASITSTISLNEISITFLHDEHRMSRRNATVVSNAFVVVMAVLCALSFNVLGDVKLFGMTIFDFFNYIGSNVFMLLGGLFTALYVGWFLKRKTIKEQLRVGNNSNRAVVAYVTFCLRYVAPVAVILIFFFFVGII
ncbi:MAG: sodium-dependent transporter [Muribaculaceae bacterium]|nr:sodium-dependent transporter [Muribaculaceae bacterium]